ncbi:MAG: hypothetical protein COX80_05155 [Candidatus Magasanikbacteria bacterium CG_4_10_14_0_2_um_filter_33_14]|uniref:Uncharacterized protein n=1 Tax=Candidatus Magasanikbacteria bacterium CG_4_10_14_0_2_um_filter_33_14 TaxID=1974636 RepID=A0A2M7V8D4_9BACT|nr:MAG: hypothetical protein COX80_05155 [Candidatus Magasanikbacteria bacterium CG_4_10_14_0_2_um_filter_33_14]
MPQTQENPSGQEVLSAESLEATSPEQEANDEIGVIDVITDLEGKVFDAAAENRKSLDALSTEAAGDSELSLSIEDILKENEALVEETNASLNKEVPVSKDSLLDFLQSGDLEKVWVVFDQLELSAEELSSPEIQQAAQACLVMALEDSAVYKGESFNALRIMENFRMSADVVNVAEVRQAASACLARSLEMRWTEISFVQFDELNKKFEFSRDEIVEAFRKSLENALSQTYNDLYMRTLDEIMQKLELSEDVLKSAEIQKTGEEAFSKMLASRNEQRAVGIKDKLHLSDEAVKKAGKLALYDILADGDYNLFSDKIIKLCDLPQTEVQDSVKRAVPGLLAEGRFKDVQGVLKSYPLDDEYMNSLFVQESTKSGLITRLREFDGMNTILPHLEGLQVSDEIIDSPEVQDLAKEALSRETNRMNIAKIKEVFHLAA